MLDNIILLETDPTLNLCQSILSGDDLIPICEETEEESIVVYDNLITTNSKLISGSCMLQGTLPCHPNQPICSPLRALCQYELDEYDHIRYCPNGGHLRTCGSIACPTRFKCPLSYCVSVRRVCDQIWDCPHGEDENETYCHDRNGACSGMFRCKNGDCLDLSEVCNQYPDCGPTAEDERYCNISHCHTNCQCEGLVINCVFANASSETFSITGYRSFSLIFGMKQLPQISHGVDLLKMHLSCYEMVEFGQSPFADFSALIELQISNSPKLSCLRAHTFQGLQALRSLLLINNAKLSYLPPEVFSGVHKLVYIDMSDTCLTALPDKLFHSLKNLKRINLQRTCIRVLNLNMLSSLQSPNMNLTGMSSLTTLHVYRPDTSHNGTYKISTDSPFICCLLTPALCSGPQSSITWCGTNITMTTQVVWGVLSLGLAITGISCIVIRFMKPMRDKLMFVGLIASHGMDLLTSFSSIMVTMKEVVYPTTHIYTTASGKNVWCIVASAIQLYSIIGMPFIITCISFSYKTGIEKGPDRTGLSIIAGVFCMTAIPLGLAVMITLLIVNSGAFSLTDACSLLWSGEGAVTFPGLSAGVLCFVLAKLNVHLMDFLEGSFCGCKFIEGSGWCFRTSVWWWKSSSDRDIYNYLFPTIDWRIISSCHVLFVNVEYLVQLTHELGHIFTCSQHNSSS